MKLNSFINEKVSNVEDLFNAYMKKIESKADDLFPNGRMSFTFKLKDPKH